jgi:DNA invertase Pin-like site-specific DNA recombinase
MRIALYARVSTADQHPEAQLAPLRAWAATRGAEVAEFVDRGVSGRKDRRPALDRLLASLRHGEVDAIAVVKLDRLARSVRHLTMLAAEFEALEVDLIALDQGIDTSSAAGRLLFHILGSIGEFEADLISDRTRAGLAAARARGKRLGRPSTVDRERVRSLRGEGLSMAAIGRELGVTKSAVQRALAA